MSRPSSFDATPFVPHRDIPLVDESIRPYSCVINIAQPTAPVEESRGRSRSRSSLSRSRSVTPDLMRRPSPICVYRRSPSRRRRHSPSPRRRHGRSRSRSRSLSSSRSWIPCTRVQPGCVCTDTSRTRPSRSRSPSFTAGPQFIPPVPPPPPVIVMPPMSPPSPSSWYVSPPVWPSQVPKLPVDILTFHYNKNMAYAPAAKTYDEAIDMVVELWPELREVERDRISLLVTGSDHLVRVPRMTWTAVLCDVPRYEVVHVQVEEQPPPPQYQGKGKGKWGDNNEKGRRSSGLFSSIRRIFFG